MVPTALEFGDAEARRVEAETRRADVLAAEVQVLRRQLGASDATASRITQDPPSER